GERDLVPNLDVGVVLAGRAAERAEGHRAPSRRGVTLTGAVARTPALQRIYSQVRRRTDGCLEWTGAVEEHGQPTTRDDNGRTVFVHRLIYEDAHGPIGRRLLHRTCDNRRCVELDHL